jgi:hypothetical protein
VASDGTVNVTVAFPLEEVEADAIEVLVEDVTYHFTVIGSFAG